MDGKLDQDAINKMASAMYQAAKLQDSSLDGMRRFLAFTEMAAEFSETGATSAETTTPAEDALYRIKDEVHGLASNDGYY